MTAVHHYDYEADSWAAASFRPPRFASEFGLQSWCSLESLRGVTEPGDWDVDGEMVRDRNHHTDGEGRGRGGGGRGGRRGSGTWTGRWSETGTITRTVRGEEGGGREGGLGLGRRGVGRGQGV